MNRRLPSFCPLKLYPDYDTEKCLRSKRLQDKNHFYNRPACKECIEQEVDEATL